MVTEVMPNLKKGFGLIAIVGALLTSCFPVLPPIAPIPAPTMTIPLVSYIKWENNLDVASQRAVNEDKMLLLFYYTDMSFWCSMMTNNVGVLNLEDVKQFINERLVPVKFDVAKSKELQELILVVPTMVLVAPTTDGGQIVGLRQGYVSPAEFDLFVEEATTSWNDLTRKDRDQ